MVKLEVGQSLKPSDVEMGDDFYFECRINANPKPFKVVWRKNVSMEFVTLFYFSEKTCQLVSLQIIHSAKRNFSQVAIPGIRDSD